MLELIATAEVAAVHIVFEIESQANPAVVARAEAETEAGVGAEIRLTLIIVERITAARHERRTGADIEADRIRRRRDREQQTAGRRQEIRVGFVDRFTGDARGRIT